MKKYKALMLDLDGTTVPNSRNGMPSKKVTDAIAKAKHKLHIGIATGRPFDLVVEILEHLDLSGPIIILDGTQIVDFSSKKLLFEQPMRKEDMDTVVKLLQDLKIRFFLDERHGTLEHKKGYEPVAPVSLIAVNMKEKQAEILQEKLSHIPTIATHKIKGWTKGSTGLSITHAAATKQHAILKVSEILKIEPHEIIGVGDGYNDFPLLMACGLKIAMGNAVPELKEISDFVAPTVDEDGVAWVIEKFVLGNNKI